MWYELGGYDGEGNRKNVAQLSRKKLSSNDYMSRLYEHVYRNLPESMVNSQRSVLHMRPKNANKPLWCFTHTPSLVYWLHGHLFIEPYSKITRRHSACNIPTGILTMKIVSRPRAIGVSSTVTYGNQVILVTTWGIRFVFILQGTWAWRRPSLAYPDSFLPLLLYSPFSVSL